MFEVRHHAERGWYVIHAPDGHLAHIERDGHQVAAFFDTKGEAEDCRRVLNAKHHGAPTRER
ncbi:hypothetical protein RB200_13815 [Streptomyces sp. PmtG]